MTTFKAENFHYFLLNRKCFTLNSLLAIGIHYQMELLPRKSSREHSFSILTTKVPLKCFALYGICITYIPCLYALHWAGKLVKHVDVVSRGQNLLTSVKRVWLQSVSSCAVCEQDLGNKIK